MGRPGITQEDIYRAAQAIAEAGAFPTIQSVHARIGSGSLGTIHKYLQAWKQERLLKPAIKIESGKDAIKVKKIVDENLEFEKIIQKQMEQNIALSSQVLTLEQDNAELKDKLGRAAVNLQELQIQNADLAQKFAVHNTLIAELKVAHNEAITFILKDKNLEIESLKEELKTVHLASLEMVRTTSFEGQDLLMTERVKNINLLDQVKTLSNKLAQFERRIISSNKGVNEDPQKTAEKVVKTYTIDELIVSGAIPDNKNDEGGI